MDIYEGAKGIGLGCAQSFAENGDITVCLDVDTSAADGIPAGAEFHEVMYHGSVFACTSAPHHHDNQHGAVRAQFCREVMR